MGLIGVHASTDTAALDKQAQAAKNAIGLMNALQRGRAKESQIRVKPDLSAPENLPALPFIWSSDPAAQNRARRWYFANKVPKGSKGGRYERTGALEAATQVNFYEEDNGGFFQLENGASGAEFVIAEKQVPSHYLSGWGDVDEAAAKEAEILSGQMVSDWNSVSVGIPG